LQPPDALDPVLYKYARNAFAAASEPRSPCWNWGLRTTVSFTRWL